MATGEGDMMVEQSNVATDELNTSNSVGPGGVPKGQCYNPGNPVFTCSECFPTPPPIQPDPDEWLKGYGTQTHNPMYRTTSSTYGSHVPTVHTMPTCFHCKSQKFSEHLGQCGMYRNHSLNTGKNHTLI
ncbi:piercer of microtubule wall 1 protein-like isoform X2 [Tubulanus polymorphus]|uniref:piercer of microtubule wall 1 protein-like isoform X2 n=1 Tax=Tubulanus polymorphus TaxID=672921 RepID=UPI003DA3B4C2